MESMKKKKKRRLLDITWSLLFGTICNESSQGFWMEDVFTAYLINHMPFTILGGSLDTYFIFQIIQLTNKSQAPQPWK